MAQTVDWGPGQATLHGGHRCLWTLSSARISCSSSSSTEEICISFQPQHPSIVTATRAVHERTPTWRGGQEPPVGPRVERARESGREEGIGRKGRDQQSWLRATTHPLRLRLLFCSAVLELVCACVCVCVCVCVCACACVRVLCARVCKALAYIQYCDEEGTPVMRSAQYCTSSTKLLIKTRDQ